jgi:sec-independent protein translocase protein TatC
LIQQPLIDLHIPLNFTHPTESLDLYLKTSFYAGTIVAGPFVLYQLWLFLAPTGFSSAKRYILLFMSATVVLFCVGRWFGHHWVLPEALRVLVLDMGKNFHPVLSIEEYTSFFSR